MFRPETLLDTLPVPCTLHDILGAIPTAEDVAFRMALLEIAGGMKVHPLGSLGGFLGGLRHGILHVAMFEVTFGTTFDAMFGTISGDCRALPSVP